MLLRHKHDRVISATEITTWKTCRQKWFWRYVRRIEKDRSPQMNLGLLCHVGMEAALNGINVRNAIEVAAKELFEEMPIFVDDDGYAFDSERVITQANFLVKHFHISNSEKFFRVIATEQDWEIPVKGSNPPIKYNGRIDALCEDLSGSRWIDEFKFVSAFKDEKEIEFSSQLALYRTVYPDVKGVRYHQILTKIPATPSQNKDGSMSRREIYTTWEVYKRSLIAAGLDPDSYAEEMIPKLANKVFWKTYHVFYSPERMAFTRDQLRGIAQDIAAPQKYIYMCDNHINCASCAFQDLCLETVRGRDPEQLIATMYRERVK